MMTSHPPHVAKPIRICPCRIPITYTTTWYTLPTAPGFRICTKCFAQDLASTPFAPNFVPVVESGAVERKCTFNTPRVHAILSSCLATSDFAPLATYINARATFRPCPGPDNPADPADQIIWHKLDAAPGGLTACQECYEDYIKPGRVGSQLNSIYPTHALPVRQPHDELWICDLASTYAARVAKEARNWQDLRAALEAYTKQPRCGGPSPVHATSRQWYRLRKGVVAALIACEACFMQFAAVSDMAIFWERVPLPAHLGANVSLACTLANAVIRESWMLAFEDKDLALFSRAAEETLASPVCGPQGIQDPSCDWYGIREVPGKEFAVCGGCFAGLVRPWGTMDETFIRIPPPKASGQSRICDLNPAAQRFQGWMRKLSESVDKREPSIFVEYAQRAATMPPCPGPDPTEGGARKWWGTDDFLACEDCAVEVVVGTPLERILQYRGTGIPGHRKCDFYSPRTRGYWSEANAAPDRGQGITVFIEKMREREAIYHQTYVEVQKSIKMMEQMFKEGLGPQPIDPATKQHLMMLEAQWREVE